MYIDINQVLHDSPHEFTHLASGQQGKSSSHFCSVIPLYGEDDPAPVDFAWRLSVCLSLSVICMSCMSD